MNGVNSVVISGFPSSAPNTKPRHHTSRFQYALNNKQNRHQDLTKDETELKKACQELESVFLYQMIRAMRSTVPKGGLIDKGFGGEVFESMLDEEFARQMAMTGSTGIADLLFSQLNTRNKIRA